MIIVRFKGGVGNQLFQYAAGRALAERHGVPLRFDVRWYGSPAAQQTTPRTFDLLHFALGGKEASSAELLPFLYSEDRRRLSRWMRRAGRVLWRRKLLINDCVGYDHEFDRLPARTMLDGYFQHPGYFKSVASLLRQECCLRQAPPPEVLARAADLSSGPTVCIQVRRTDFVLDPKRAAVHGTCSVEYFKDAWRRIQELVPGARGIVVPDDHRWAAGVFSGWPRLSLLGPEWNGPGFMHQFYLMRSCRHFIIANSTWGWWAAWLGESPEKTVVMPERWFRDEAMNVAATGLRLPGWHVC